MLLLFLGFLCLLTQATRLNYVIIYIDDLGYNDTNIGKGPFVRSNVNTPNLARMANEGVLFDNFYTGASTCSPSRAALLGGKFPPLFNFFGVTRAYLSPGQNTGLPKTGLTNLANYLKGCGYKTGTVGKWHLGRSEAAVEDVAWMPLQQGFDFAELVSPIGNAPSCTSGEIAPCQRTPAGESYYPFCVQGLNFWPCTGIVAPYIPWNCTYGVPVPVGGSSGPNPTRNAGFCQLYRGNQLVQQPWEIANMTQRLLGEALNFFDARAQDQNPFFFFFSHIAVHEPWFSSRDFFGKSAMGTYGDMIEEMDWSVGKVLDRLNVGDLGPTHVYFLSDNGAFLEKNPGISNPAFQTSSGQLRGGKGQHYEGGVRTPAIVWANAQTEVQNTIPLARGKYTQAVGHTVDIFKTIASQQTCGAIVQTLDGKDLTPVLTNPSLTTSSWQAPNQYLPYFCENNIVGARWLDPGQAATPTTPAIPPRQLKVVFASVSWTLPSAQSCPIPNPYVPSVCSCQQLVPLLPPLPPNDPTKWIQLFDIVANVNEDPAQNLLVTSPLANYYRAKLVLLNTTWLQPLLASYDSNPLSATGVYDIRASTPVDGTGAILNAALLPCPGGSPPCTINSETGATKVTVTISPNPSFFGQVINFHAAVSTVNSGTPINQGQLYFRINTPFSRTGLGSLLNYVPSPPAPTPGWILPLPGQSLSANPFIPITAEYQGIPSTYLASTSDEKIVTVLPARTQVTVTAAPSNPVIGDVVTVTANVQFIPGQGSGPLVGNVTFSNNAVAFQTLPVAGVGNYQTTITFNAVSDNSITATFTSSSPNFASSAPSTAVALHVKAVPTVTFTSDPVTNVVIGQPIQYTVTVLGYSPTGTVTFQPDGTIVPLTAGSASATIKISSSLGTVPVTITYSGDSNNVPATGSDTKEVAQATATVQLTRNPDTDIVVGQPVTFSVLVTTNVPSTLQPLGAVRFDPLGVVVALNGGAAQTVFTPQHSGTTEVSATFVSDPDYFAESTSNSISQVTKSASTTTKLTSAKVNRNQVFTATVTANSPSTSTPTGAVHFHRGPYSQIVALNNGVAVYTVNNFKGRPMNATYLGNADYLPSWAWILA